MEERSEAQLIKAYLSGDDSSLEVLFARHLKGAYAYVARLVGTQEADDAVQEGFVKAWRNLKTFDPNRPFRPWLYRIVHNAALDLLKKRRPAAFSSLETDDGLAFEETIKDTTPLPSDLLERVAASSDLLRILSDLPFKQRTVLLLHYEENMTFADIGDILEESLNTVKSRHHRAVLTLRAKLTDIPHQ